MSHPHPNYIYEFKLYRGKLKREISFAKEIEFFMAKLVNWNEIFTYSLEWIRELLLTNFFQMAQKTFSVTVKHFVKCKKDWKVKI